MDIEKEQKHEFPVNLEPQDINRSDAENEQPQEILISDEPDLSIRETPPDEEDTSGNDPESEDFIQNTFTQQLEVEEDDPDEIPIEGEDIVEVPLEEEILEELDEDGDIDESEKLETPEDESAAGAIDEERVPVDQLAGIVEALIFVSGDPVPMKRLVDVLEAQDEHIREAIGFLSERYVENHAGVQIMEVAGGFQMRTRPIYSSYVNRFLERKKKFSLSGPALESLAIIAYKQPITRAEIEAIRGVAVDGVLKSLLDKRLIKVTGVKDVLGRPNLYGTTKHFLEYFGLNSLKDLPPIEDLSKTFSGGSAQQRDKTAERTEKATENYSEYDNERQSEPHEPESGSTDESNTP